MRTREDMESKRPEYKKPILAQIPVEFTKGYERKPNGQIVKVKRDETPN